MSILKNSSAGGGGETSSEDELVQLEQDKVALDKSNDLNNEKTRLENDEIVKKNFLSD